MALPLSVLSTARTLRPRPSCCLPTYCDSQEISTHGFFIFSQITKSIGMFSVLRTPPSPTPHSKQMLVAFMLALLVPCMGWSTSLPCAVTPLERHAGVSRVMPLRMADQSSILEKEVAALQSGLSLQER